MTQQAVVWSGEHDWEEEEALDAFERMLAAPEESEYVWLLLSPGRYSTTPLRRQ